MKRMWSTRGRKAEPNTLRLPGMPPTDMPPKPTPW
ncbi:Uncharacterised protein [Mycobacterium tuberculosis]|nr:Uncharacterised protein [Mycobacterium tuberculosis]